MHFSRYFVYRFSFCYNIAKCFNIFNFKAKAEACVDSNAFTVFIDSKSTNKIFRILTYHLLAITKFYYLGVQNNKNQHLKLN